MGLTIFEETFGTERVRYGKVSKREATVEHLATITSAVQKVVDTFRDPNTGQRFIVSLSPNTEAYTTPDTKRIVVSYKPIFDKGLKVSTVCTVMTGLVLHEIGHTLYTFPNSAEFAKAFGTPGQWTGDYYRNNRKKAWDQLAYTVLNIGDDARLEARMVENLPVAASVFPTMLHWVAITAGMVNEPFKWTGKALSMSERVNFAGRAVRYPWTARWSSDEFTRAERVWWVNWGADYIALDDHDAAGMVRLTKVALDRLRNPADLGFDKVTQPKQPPGPGGSQPPIDDEDEDEDADDDEQDEQEPPQGGTKQPFGDDFDRDESDDEADADEDEDEDDDESDEDSDEDGDEDKADDEDNPGDDADDDEQDDESGDESGDDDEDADDDETDDEGGSETDAPTTDNPDGDDESKDGEPDDGGKDGEHKQDTKDESGDFKQDFDAHDLKGNVDAINHPEDWQTQNGGTLVQKLLDTERLTERVGTGKWGTAKVEMRSMEQFVKRGY